ncbi:MAG: SirB2 family protein [Stagnimonas sp.]|nr:SirB2 family protein [Stagnimonas sp.]
MIEFYPQIRQAHILLVALSGSLFLARGIAVLMQAGWPQQRAVKLLSYAIDTALLGAALMLVRLLPSGVFSNGWLAMKLLLLVVYILLGAFALRRARSQSVRAVCFLLAVLVFSWMLTIARSHHPLGILRLWSG